MRQSDHHHPQHARPRSPSSVRVFRAAIGLGLLAFAVILFSLVFRHDTQWSPVAAPPTAAAVVAELPPTPAQQPAQPAVANEPGAATAQAPLVELAPDAVAQPVAVSAGREAQPAPDAKPGEPAPFWGPNYNAADGKPRYVCGANTVASGLTLQVIQMSGIDVANGFHLGIVPISLNDTYRLGDDDYSEKVRSGDWDCVIEYVDENAELNMGVITAVIDESAGEIGIASRQQLASYEDLAGKRIGMVDSHTTKYFANYTLTLLPEAARKTVTVNLYKSPDEALAAYLAGTLDAVSLTEPHLSQAATSVGSHRLVDTSQLRVIASSIITSRASIARRPELVQAFHAAWFAALKEQIDNFDGAAALIAAWGQGQWTGVTPANAVADLRTRLKFSAQATLKQNANLGANPAPVLSILDTARAMWQSELAEEGKPLPDGTPEVKTLVDFSYVLQASANNALAVKGKPVNSTFSLQAAAPAAPAADAPAVAVASTPTAGSAAPTATSLPAPAATAVTTATRAAPAAPEEVAVLPCRTFNFLANSTQLTAESQRLLDVCVLPALRQRASVSLKVRGSAAWPTGGDYTEESVRLFGESRANAIVDYLVAQGIDRKRFLVEGVAPPPERRGITDTAKLAADRFVEMTLIVGGL